MKYTFLPDRIVIIMTIFVLISIVYMIYHIVHATKWYTALPMALAVALFIYFALKTPYCTYIEKETIIVKQVWGSIKITDIKSIKPIKEKELSDAIRVFGNGGFLGYVGRFRSPRFGKFYMAVINTKELAKIETHSGKVYVINYPYTLLNPGF